MSKWENIYKSIYCTGSVVNIYAVDSGGFMRGLWSPSIDCHFVYLLYYTYSSRNSNIMWMIIYYDDNSNGKIVNRLHKFKLYPLKISIIY